jgi:uncharacterized membrane protein
MSGAASGSVCGAVSGPVRGAARCRWTRLQRDPEEGSTLLLTIFYGFMALVLVLLVVAATSLYLERKRLFTLADGAALVGAESFALADVTVTERGLRATLTGSEVSSAVRAYMSAADTSRFEQLQIVAASTPDGRSATVTLTSTWRPPVVSLFVPEGLRLEVTSTARSVFG